MERVLAFDVETPNAHNDRICSIGIALIENNKIVLLKNYFVNPECRFDEKNVNVHGIRPSDVANAPTFPEVWDEIGSLFRQSLVIAHNATFDLCVLKKTLAFYGISESLLYYVCTMRMAKEWLRELPNAKLSTICNYYGIDLVHHDSGSDSAACAQIYLNLLEEGRNPERLMASYSFVNDSNECEHGQKARMSDNTKALLTLSGILSGITCDNVLTAGEVNYLQTWLNNNTELKGNYPYNKVYQTIEKALSDGILDAKELEEMLCLFKRVSDPMSECNCKSSSNEIMGKRFCLSGEFDYGDKATVEAFLVACGGISQKSVTQKTNFLIVGGQGSSAWSAGNYGNKVKKALELQEKGFSIQIVRESEFDFSQTTESIASEELVMEQETLFLEDENILVNGDASERAMLYFEEIIALLRESNRGFDLEKVEIEHRIPKSSGAYDTILILGQPCFHLKGKRVRYLYFSPTFEKLLKKTECHFEPSASGRWARVSVEEFTGFSCIKEQIEELYESCLRDADGFDCCGSYMECSDAGRCVKNDIMFAGKCRYRQNLKIGRIFYGANRNI